MNLGFNYYVTTKIRYKKALELNKTDKVELLNTIEISCVIQLT